MIVGWVPADLLDPTVPEVMCACGYLMAAHSNFAEFLDYGRCPDCGSMLAPPVRAAAARAAYRMTVGSGDLLDRIRTARGSMEAKDAVLNALFEPIAAILTGAAR